MPKFSWVVEPVFSDLDAFAKAAGKAGHDLWVLDPEDDVGFLRDKLAWPTSRSVFRGSLQVAAQLHGERNPVSFCAAERWHYTSYRLYPGVAEFLLNQAAEVLPASVLISRRDPTDPSSLFVRPDSCMKPFSGRVVRVSDLSWKALDRGFYYDEDVLVVVAPACEVRAEYRCVVVCGEVVAGCRYDKEGRSPGMPVPVLRFAQEVAGRIEPPEEVYVMDVCEKGPDGELRVVELNPFSGADLYLCDAGRVVSAVARSVLR